MRFKLTLCRDAMDQVKRLPCWIKVVAAIFVLIFVFNWPTTSGEWAAWIQAFGVIGAIGGGFASTELGRRRTELEELNFLYDAVKAFELFLLNAQKAMEVRNPETGEVMKTKPVSGRTSEIRPLIEIISARPFRGLPFAVVRELKRSALAVTEYLDALDAEDFKDVRDAVINAMTILDIEARLKSVDGALQAIESQRTIVKNRPLFSFT